MLQETLGFSSKSPKQKRKPEFKKPDVNFIDPKKINPHVMMKAVDR